MRFCVYALYVEVDYIVVNFVPSVSCGDKIIPYKALVLAVHLCYLAFEVHMADVLAVRPCVVLVVKGVYQLVNRGVDTHEAVVACVYQIELAYGFIFVVVHDFLVRAVVYREVALDHHAFLEIAPLQCAVVGSPLGVISHFSADHHDERNSYSQKHYSRVEKPPCSKSNSHFITYLLFSLFFRRLCRQS